MEVLMGKKKKSHQLKSNATIKDMEQIDAQYKPRTTPEEFGMKGKSCKIQITTNFFFSTLDLRSKDFSSMGIINVL